MSDQELARPFQTDKSSVKFVRNAKGDTQVELKVIAGETEDEIARIRTLALDEYRKAVEATGGLVA